MMEYEKLIMESVRLRSALAWAVGALESHGRDAGYAKMVHDENIASIASDLIGEPVYMGDSDAEPTDT